MNTNLFNLDGQFYATDNQCPHMGYPLTRGAVRHGILTWALLLDLLRAGGDQEEFRHLIWFESFSPPQPPTAVENFAAIRSAFVPCVATKFSVYHTIEKT